MKVLVFGGGGREHAVAWAIAQSPRVSELVVAPGNGGIDAWGATVKLPVRCAPVDGTSLSAMLALTVAEHPDLTVIGPEVPLALGLVDELEARGLRVFGPTKAAAQLESSKAFAKDFLREHGIPTAAYAVCRSAEDVARELSAFTVPVVVKADGLAAGKGVVICTSKEEAQRVAVQMFSGELLGATTEQIVVEEFLHGDELSFFAICDGIHAIPLAAAQDHKRIGEGDTGPNTGGMGAYSTDALLSPAMRDWLTAKVAQPVVDGMAAAGTPFKGILFCGIMMVPEEDAAADHGTAVSNQNAGIRSAAKDTPVIFCGKAVRPMVLEFNTRFGDPETQALMLRLDTAQTDVIDLFEAAIDGTADSVQIAMRPGASVCVIAASEGYPGSYLSGRRISGLAKSEDSTEVTVFHSGTARKGEEIVTTGGRVLGITAYAPDLASALALAYRRLTEIHFDGMQFRRDIGWRALRGAKSCSES